MDGEKVYTQETIEETAFPAEDAVASYEETQSTANSTYSQETVKEQTMPTRRIAVDVIGTVINTKSKKILQPFSFAKSGAIQIGEYENGVSGEVKISPDGLVARNKSGNTTIAIDGDTGDAVFAGTIQAGTLISGKVIVGNSTWIIDGDETNPVIILYKGDIASIVIGSPN